MGQRILRLGPRLDYNGPEHRGEIAGLGPANDYGHKR